MSLEKLIQTPEDLDQISLRILKYLEDHKPLSKAFDELENELPTDEKDEHYLRDFPETTKSKMTNEYLETLSKSKKQQKEFLAKSEKKNLRTLAKVKEKLKVNMKRSFDKQENRYRTKRTQLENEVKQYFRIRNNDPQIDLSYDKELMNKLKGIFNEIRSQKIRSFSRKGKKPIVQRVIQTKLSGNMRDCFETRKATNALTFNFVVDQSGSMSGDTLRIAELIKTFFKAIEDLKEIKINVIGYESSTLNIVENDQSKLSRIAYDGGSTPSCEAITYAGSMIRKQSGKNVLIFVSDGQPDPIGKYFSTGKYIQYVLNDLKKEKQIDSFGILIGSYSNFYEFSKIFGSNFAQFDDITEANDQLLKIFKAFVEEYLRTA